MPHPKPKKLFGKAINWFTENHMIANPDKCKAIVIKKDGQDTSGITFKINDQEIQSSKEVTLLGIYRYQ